MENIKILLINPSLKRPERISKRKRFVPVGIPLSISYLAAYLKEKNIEFDIYDERLEPLHDGELEKLINEKGINVVGLSCTTPYIYRALDLANTVKKISPEIKIVLGGVHPSVMTDECLQNESVDYVVRHEGEITLWEFLKSLQGELDIKDVKGLSYKENGSIIHNPDRLAIEDLDSLPPFPFHLFEKQKDRYFFRILTSRGCPYRCIFCSARSITGRKYRYRSAEQVIKDIDLLVNQFCRSRIGFADDTFTANKDRVIKLCELIIDRGLHKKATFYCMTRGDTVDRHLLEIMKTAGFRGISFGIETGSNRIMKLIKKGETIESNIRAVKTAKDIGFIVRGSFILGFPTETREESRETINLALKNPFDYAMFNLPIPYPGTELYEIAKREGNRYTDFSNFDAMEGLLKKQTVYIPKGRTKKELIRLQRKAYFLFYFRLKQVINFLKIGLPEVDLRLLNLRERINLGFKIIARLIKGEKKNSHKSS